MDVQITLGGLTFNPSPDPGTGTRHYVDSLEGWLAPGPVRQQVLPRSGEHGGVITESLFEPRPLLMRGESHVASGTSVWTVAQQLSAVFDAIRSDTTLKVYETITKRASVRIAGTARIEQVGPSYLQWEVPLIAPDPRKYGETLHSETVVIDNSGDDQTSTMTVLNAGTAQAYPEKIRLWGSGAPDLKVMRTDTSQEIILTTGPVNDNEYLIYPQERLVYYGVPTTAGDPAGMSSSYEKVGSGTRWFMLRAGVGTQIRLRRSNTPAAQLKATLWFRDAWI